MGENPDQPRGNSVPQTPVDTLGMSEQEMRRLGYKVVDMVVDRLQHREREPAITTGSAAALHNALGGPLPENPSDTDESLSLLADVALAHQQHGDHPRYFARVPGPASFAAVLGEWLGTGFNTIATSWAGGSGPATLELVVIDWLRQLMGFPASAEGVLVSGGSHGNLTAFSVARSELGAGTVYLSDQAHASLLRNLRQLGWAESDIRVIPCDENYRMPTQQLAAAIAQDRIAGSNPMLVIASAGTTNTGTVDPLLAIADICEAQNCWLHVDGAYGAPAALTARGERYLAGMERADSLTLDPHKWLFQPYDIGCLLVRHAGALERCFSMNPEYLKDVEGENDEIDFRNRSLELSRRSRAVKLWLSLRSYGVRSFRDAIQQGIELAEFAESWLRSRPQQWQVVSPAQIGITCFALIGQEHTHASRAQRLAASGYACVSTTELKGRSVLRLCTINPLTTREDIVGTLERLGADFP